MRFRVPMFKRDIISPMKATEDDSVIVQYYSLLIVANILVMALAAFSAPFQYLLSLRLLLFAQVPLVSSIKTWGTLLQFAGCSTKGSENSTATNQPTDRPPASLPPFGAADSCRCGGMFDFFLPFVIEIERSVPAAAECLH